MSKKNKNTGPIVYSTNPQAFSSEPDQKRETLPAAQQQLRVVLETKHRAGKAVTIVYGFSGSEDDLEVLGKKLKNYCGSGGSVKDGEVIVQGDHRQKVLQWLLKEGFVKTKVV
jgi:translation initiation factor 1